MRIAAAAVGAVMLSASMAAASPVEETITYSVQQAGDVEVGLGQFAEKVHKTLHHKRGWSLDGRIDFRRVSSDANMELVLASPEAVEEAAPGCDAAWSCRVAEQVLINEERWRNATDSWELSVRAYQHYVVNHEVGHFLELGHRHCPEPGAPAPVMQQQSKDKEGCRSNVWPRLPELRAAAANQDVSVPDRSPQPSRDGRDGGPPKNGKNGKKQAGQQKSATPKRQKPSQQPQQPVRRSAQRPETPTPAAVQAGSRPDTATTRPQPADQTMLRSVRDALPGVTLTVLVLLVVVGALGGLFAAITPRRARDDKADASEPPDTMPTTPTAPTAERATGPAATPGTRAAGRRSSRRRGSRRR